MDSETTVDQHYCDRKCYPSLEIQWFIPSDLYDCQRIKNRVFTAVSSVTLKDSWSYGNYHKVSVGSLEGKMGCFVVLCVKCPYLFCPMLHTKEVGFLFFYTLLASFSLKYFHYISGKHLQILWLSPNNKTLLCHLWKPVGVKGNIHS